MPELPHVVAFKRYLDATALHQRIETTHVRESRVLAVSPSTLRRHLLGKAFAGSRRHGKQLFVAVEGGERVLRLHFGMTGQLHYHERGDAPDHTAVLFDFDGGGHLAFVNPRTFGEIDLVRDVDDWIDAHLGPDAHADGFDLAAFRDALAGRRGSLKRLLMDQSVIAGLGNLYVDELLFQCGLHPRTDVDELAEDAVGTLYRTLRRILDKAIDVNAERDRLPRTWLLPQREDGAACPRCDGEIARTEVAGRATYWCPGCQSRAG